MVARIIGALIMILGIFGWWYAAKKMSKDNEE